MAFGYLLLSGQSFATHSIWNIWIDDDNINPDGFNLNAIHSYPYFCLSNIPFASGLLEDLYLFYSNGQEYDKH